MISWYTQYRCRARLPDAAIDPYVDIIFGLGALMLSWLLLQARLVPGWLAIWGLAGGALYLALQEIALAIWLIVKGFAEHIVADANREPEPQLSL